MQTTDPIRTTDTRAQSAEWRQLTIEFTDRDSAEHIGAHDLGPALTDATAAGLLECWWYIRKHPTWRLRYLPRDREGDDALSVLLGNLAKAGIIAGWVPGIYEPETAAFGGDAGMDVAHHLFHADSRHLLTRALITQTSSPASALGRRESSVVLCSALMRAAGLDWYEQGDVWAKVADLRPPPAPTAAPAPEVINATRRLMTVNARPLCESGGALEGYRPWVTAFEEAGQALGDLARHGRLSRGLRAVLAHHVIFHANRAGLPQADQSTLAALASLASQAVFAGGNSGRSEPGSAPSQPPVSTNLDEVTTLSQDSSTPSADQLRAGLVDDLREQNVVRTLSIEQALRQVPRHLFVPGFALQQAYADDAVHIKSDADGTSISAASQPRIVAMMLEQLAAQPGQRVCEAGAGTGYNAALMARIVGETGHVSTIDVDADLVDGARAHLAAAGVSNVDVVLGDGALGHRDAAPYDRFIATVGVWDIPAPWLEQLTPAGRLVVPLRLRGAQSRSIAFERSGPGWASCDSQLAVFMPLRGLGDDAPRTVTLTPERDVTLQVHQDQTLDPQALTGVLERDGHTIWTAVTFAPMVSFEWLDLWLACRLDNALMRMSVQPTATARGQVSPMFGWGSMATTRDGDLAYLTLRPATPDSGGGKLYDVGVTGHGPTGRDLAATVAQEVATWATGYRDRSVRFEIPTTTVIPDSDAGRFVLGARRHPITVTWQ
jgi:protein-L-isoaspartate(D-aspartate) O-methyltransferase